MSNNYNSRVTKFTILFFLFFFTSGLVHAQSEVPNPDVAYKFDYPDSGKYVTGVTDASLSDGQQDAYWVNWFESDDKLTGGYAPNSGKFGGAWYTSGQHLCCAELAT
ncbi:MAG: hypothetical protein HC896_18870, partial [Bacteroidales bacterium]|nr:hypothetical protein [Bacteroidales bacterium]